MEAHKPPSSPAEAVVPQPDNVINLPPALESRTQPGVMDFFKVRVLMCLSSTPNNRHPVPEVNGQVQTFLAGTLAGTPNSPVFA